MVGFKLKRTLYEQGYYTSYPVQQRVVTASSTKTTRVAASDANAVDCE